MIDLNPSHTKRAGTVSDLHELVDAVRMSSEKRRAYIGASVIGGPCDRRIQWDFLQEPYDEGWAFSARTRRIFQRGHVMEDMAAVWLSDAGFRLERTGRDGKPLGFSVANGALAGHVDRVVTSGPGDLHFPFIWEHKALGAKSWKAISDKGVVKAKPEYADQVYMYQAYMDLTGPALFQATCADTMEIHFEWVPFDKARAQAMSDRAANLIADSRAGYIRPAPVSEPAFYCTDCPFRRRCWG